MSNYSSIHVHHSMFFDELRNSYYAKAIAKEVSSSSVVLDLGAGLGLHGFMALESGAKKVYLVEPASIIDVTRQIVEANGLTEIVESLKGAVEEVILPEKVDLIISVFTGNFLLSEDLLPSLFFARDHFLKPGGKLIPDRAIMEAVPVMAEEYYAKHIDCWSDSNTDIDFSAIRKIANNSLYCDVPKNHKTEFLSEPAELLDLDFMTATLAACRKKVEVSITQDGLCHGWLGWFQTRVGGDWLSTSPLVEQTHWSQVFLPLGKPVQVSKGDVMTFELNRPEFGEWTWVVETGGIRQRQSTFNSSVLSPKDILKQSAAYKPTRTKKGDAAIDVLNQLDGTKSIAKVTAYLLKKYPQQFKTQSIAEQFIKSLLQLG